MKIQAEIIGVKDVSYTRKTGEQVTGWEVCISHDLLKDAKTRGKFAELAFLKTPDVVGGQPVPGPCEVELVLTNSGHKITALYVGAAK